MSDYDIRGLNFMVVDDDANMRHLVHTILSTLGVRNILSVGSAEKAFERLVEFAADVIIVDFRMEPIDGIEFTRRIRNDDDSPDRYVTVIMLTGHAERQAVEDARDVGVHEFMAKPVSAAKLYEKIVSCIENPREFIRTDVYFGPDRRRRQIEDFGGPDRRSKVSSAA